MDRQLSALDRDEDHHLEQIPGTIRPDDEPTVWVFSGIIDSECMINSVAYVVVGYTVLASRRVDLHDA